MSLLHPTDPYDSSDAAEPKALSVSRAMNLAKRALEQVRVTVMGEVAEVNDKSGYKAVYFALSDKDASMSAMMWHDAYSASGVRLRPGLLVEVTGSFSVYVPKGRMQFTVRGLRLAGEGDLRLRVAETARRLEAQGLMDLVRKRPLPQLPRRIAVVTSPRGKAVHDVIRTLRRRYPLAEVLVCGVPVEGARAPQALALALAMAQDAHADVILLVRGGGSYEDLMPFNDEALARAITASRVPVVTGIGHEPDNSIADMVADRRCSTPTAAAEACAPSVAELSERVAVDGLRLASGLMGNQTALAHRVELLAARPVLSDLHAVLGVHEQALDVVSARLARSLPGMVIARAQALERVRSGLRHAGPRLLDQEYADMQRLAGRLPVVAHAAFERRRVDLAGCESRIVRIAPQVFSSQRAALSAMAGHLEGLSPLSVLARGYALVRDGEGVVVRSVADVESGENLQVLVFDGAIEVKVLSCGDEVPCAR
jgi:exodeoxyribonuclease VII large subunit